MNKCAIISPPGHVFVGNIAPLGGGSRDDASVVAAVQARLRAASRDDATAPPALDVGTIEAIDAAMRGGGADDGAAPLDGGAAAAARDLEEQVEEEAAWWREAAESDVFAWGVDPASVRVRPLRSDFLTAEWGVRYHVHMTKREAP